MTTNEKKDLMVMKFLHYFITEKNYNPVIVHGIQNEIWLENMDSDIRIVRIVLNYIHNDEQLDFDKFKLGRLSRQIKLKTFTIKMKTMSFYLDLNEDVKLVNDKNNFAIRVDKEKDLSKDEMVNKYFPDMISKLKFTEEGSNLYAKINNDILKKNMDSSEKINDLFTPKKSIVTYLLVGIMVFIFILMYVLGNGSLDTKTLYNFGGLVKDGAFYRNITSMFLHIGIIHLVMNMWALILLGKQVENFYGHIKTLIIFIFSGLVGNLLSVILMNERTISAGASGAIFGLMGALLYFAINQRTIMGEALKREILPVIIINLMAGFMLSGINMYAHIGGFIGGIIISVALGIKYKTSKFEKINGFIASLILIGALTYLAYFM